MKSLTTLRHLMALLLLGTLSAGLAWASPSGGRTLATEKMARLLATTKIPALRAQEATVREVMEQIRHLAQLHSRDNERLNLMYLGKQDKLEMKVTCELTNLPLGEVIRYLCMAGGLKHRVEEHAVIIFDETVALEERQTRIFHVPPDSPILAPKAIK